MKLHSQRLGLAGLILSTSLNAWNLTLQSRYDSPNFELLDIEIAGNYAYVPAGLGGLNIIDISDPSSPFTVSSYSAYGCEYGRLKIIDVSSPQTAGVIGKAPSSGTAKDVIESGNYVFVAVGGRGLDMFDLSQPDNLVLVANYDTTGYASRVAVYPNPFNPAVTIEVTIPVGQPVDLDIVDISGRWVDGLYSGWLSSGVHRFRWGPSHRPAGAGRSGSGVYLAVLRGSGRASVQKLVLLK